MPKPPTKRWFASDNNAGACPQALDALLACNEGFQAGYADDSHTQRTIEHFQSLFSKNTAVFFVATGTAANTLAIASLTQPWMRVLCAEQSHWNEDESNAPERLTHCRTTTIQPHNHTTNSKITPDQIQEFGTITRGVHQPQPGVVTISNITEFGQRYTPTEIHALADTTHELGYALHIDGARFANAVAAHIHRTNCSPQDACRQLSCDSGADALSFGGTKNALLFGEAVLFFPQQNQQRFDNAVHDFPFHRKSTGHLLSKHRFVTAQFDAILKDNTWLDLAHHANTKATQLAEQLAALNVEIPFPVDANAIFAKLTPQTVSELHAQGHAFYPFGNETQNLSRFMTSFATTDEHINTFIHDLSQILASS